MQNNILLDKERPGTAPPGFANNRYLNSQDFMASMIKSKQSEIVKQMKNNLNNKMQKYKDIQPIVTSRSGCTTDAI